MNRCARCDARLPIAEKQGRPRRTCSAACRQALYRRRRPQRRIPRKLKCLPRWVRFDARKRPLRADGTGLASVTDPATWAPYAAAAESAKGEGVGFVLGNGIGCLDLDDAIDAHGKLADWARLLIAQHRDEALFIEVSRSGRGVHIFLPLAEGPGRRIREGAVKLETYSRERYIAMTGTPLATV